MSREAPPKEEAVPSSSSSESTQNRSQTSDRDAPVAAEAIVDYANLKPRALPRVGQYAVLNLRGGPKANTVWIVDLNGEHPTCNCPDQKFNKDTGQGCKHIDVVLYDAVKPYHDVDRLVLSQIADYDRRVERAVGQLERAATAQEAETAASQSSAPKAMPEKAEAQDAAERLQEAFDERVDGMNVQEDKGLVWINKSPDAPDWTFQAFLQDPDLIDFNPDDGPGQYFKNSIEPGNVDAYIREVLE